MFEMGQVVKVGERTGLVILARYTFAGDPVYLVSDKDANLAFVSASLLQSGETGLDALAPPELAGLAAFAKVVNDAKSN